MLGGSTLHVCVCSLCLLLCQVLGVCRWSLILDLPRICLYCTCVRVVRVDSLSLVLSLSLVMHFGSILDGRVCTPYLSVSLPPFQRSGVYECVCFLPVCGVRGLGFEGTHCVSVFGLKVSVLVSVCTSYVSLVLECVLNACL